MVVRLVRNSALIFSVVWVSACGKFDFLTAKGTGGTPSDAGSSPLNNVATLVGVARLAITTPAAMKQRRCSEAIRIEALDSQGNALAPPATSVMRLEGASAGDAFYTTPTCTGTAVDSQALKFPANAASMTLYAMPELSGERQLAVRGDYAGGVATAMVTREVSAIGFSAGPATAGGGRCSGPYQFQVRDLRGDLFEQTQFRYAVTLSGSASGGTTAAFVDAACTQPLGAQGMVSGSSQGSFYVRTSKLGTLTLQISSPDAAGITSSPRSTTYEPAVVAIRVTGGPSSLVLGVGNPTPLKVETLDVTGAPVAPKASDLPAGQTAFPVRVTFSQGEGTSYGVCNPVSGPSETFSINVGGLYKEFCLKAMTRTQVTIQAESPGNAFIVPVTKNLAVIEAPASLGLQGPLEGIAGMPTAEFKIQILDGLGAPIAPNPAMNIELVTSASARATFCSRPKCSEGSLLSNNLITTNGTSELSFYMVSDADLTQSFTVEVKPTIPGVTGASRAIQITRKPLSLDDPNFGTNGFASVAFPTMDRGEISAGLSSNGKLVGAGYQRIGELNTLALVRLRSTTSATDQMPGTLDTTFGSGGRVLKAVGQQSFATAIASQIQVVTVNGQAQTVEKYLVAVATYNATSNWDAAIARFNLDGTIDNAFGSYGVASLALAGNQFPFSVAVAASGVIYVAGETDTGANGDLNFLVAAFTADGKPATVANGAPVTFGTNGTITLDFANNQDSAAALSVQGIGSAERILVGGTSRADFAFAKLQRTGALDTTFGTAGKIVHDLGGDETLRAIGLPASGNPVAVGFSKVGALTNVALVRLRGVAGPGAGQVPGTLDPTFGTAAGKTISNVIDGYDEEINSLAIDPREGLLFLAGRVTNAQGSKGFLARFTRDGVLDNGLTPWFRVVNLGGIEDRANAVVLLPSGKPVLFGQGEVDNQQQMKAACFLR